MLLSRRCQPRTLTLKVGCVAGEERSNTKTATRLGLPRGQRFRRAASKAADLNQVLWRERGGRILKILQKGCNVSRTVEHADNFHALRVKRAIENELLVEARDGQQPDSF